MKQTTKVTFLRVDSNQKKLNFIASKCEEALEVEKRVQITVPNPEAAQYIDQLLWKIPEDSFIPHEIANASSEEWVVITTDLTKNLNEATLLVNLSGEISPISAQFEEIYEIIDETHPDKLKRSLAKLDEYRKQGFLVIS